MVIRARLGSMMGSGDVSKPRSGQAQAPENMGEFGGQISRLSQEWRKSRDSFRRSKCSSPVFEKNADNNCRAESSSDGGLAAAAQSGNLEACQQILTAGQIAGPNVWGPDGNTPLYVAAIGGHCEIVGWLLGNAGDPGHCNQNAPRQTALHGAALQGNGKACMMLLEAGADPRAIDDAGATPIDYASSSESVWPHFAAFGCTRSTKEQLVAKGIMRRASPNLEIELRTSGTNSADGLSREFSRPGSSYVCSAQHPPQPGSTMASSRGRTKGGCSQPTPRRSIGRPIDILSEGDVLSADLKGPLDGLGMNLRALSCA